MNDRFTISAWKHSTTLLKGLQNTSLSPGVQLLIHAANGAANPSHVSIGQIEAAITFDTLAIKTAMAGLGGITGVALASDTFYLQKLLADGLRAGATSHIKVVAAVGIIVPTILRTPARKAAVESYRAVPRSTDGVTAPLTFTAAQSLEAAQDLVPEVYTLGVVTINGTELEMVEEVTIDFGNKLDINYGTGHVYPTFTGIIEQSPIITLATNDVGALVSWGLAGAIQGGTNDSTIILNNQILGGVRGSSPITFSLDEGLYVFEDISGNQGDKYAGRIRMTPVYDGTNAIIAVTGLT
jgi:hypothetical protein